MPDEVPSTRGRQIPWLESLRPHSARAKRIALASAVVVFLCVSIWSFASLSGQVELHWWVLPVLVLVTGPLTIVANAAEFRVMGAANGHHIGWGPATRLTVMAAAANLLPVPGGVLIRTQALHQRGSTYRHALAANGAAGLVWIGCAGLIIAALLVADGDAGWVAAGAGVTGVVTLATALKLLRAVRRADAPRLFGSLLLIETGTVIVSAARIYLAFLLIGLTANVLQATALTAAQIIAAAVGIFPAGLGLREVLAGLIGSVVDVGASEAVASTAADRVTGQLSLALMTASLVAWTRLRTRKGVDRSPIRSERRS